MNAPSPSPKTTLNLHGVFVDVLGTGVLLRGGSGIGKSEVALSLVDRGHGLVADDSVILTREGEQNKVIGTCPEVLQDFLEIRGLGILNIRAMYGDTAIKKRKRLQLIANLVIMSEAEIEQIDRIHGVYTEETILGVSIPVVTIPVAPGRSLAILVEGAVRNQGLKASGYQASHEFIKRHRTFVERGEAAK